MLRIPRRIVTGHDPQGRSIIQSAEPPPQHAPRGGVRFFEFWRTARAPAVIEAEPAPAAVDDPTVLGPGPLGSVIRIVDLEPGHLHYMKLRDDGRHPGMHRTRTIDYAILIEGELVAIVGDQEEVMRPGDILIQNGTDHAWENRGAVTARVAFILLDAAFSAPLDALLPQGDLQHRPIQGVKP